MSLLCLMSSLICVLSGLIQVLICLTCVQPNLVYCRFSLFWKEFCLSCLSVFKNCSVLPFIVYTLFTNCRFIEKKMCHFNARCVIVDAKSIIFDATSCRFDAKFVVLERKNCQYWSDLVCWSIWNKEKILKISIIVSYFIRNSNVSKYLVCVSVCVCVALTKMNSISFNWFF